MPISDSSTKSRFSEFQDRLDVLMATRRSLWEVEELADRQEEVRHSETIKLIRNNTRLQDEGIDRELQALYQEALGKVGLEAGDVVKYIQDYGDFKRGECGIVQSTWHDNDHRVDMVSLEYLRGAGIAEIKVVQPVLDPDEANIFRFQMATRYMDLNRGDGLRKQLDEIKALLDGWVVADFADGSDS